MHRVARYCSCAILTLVLLLSGSARSAEPDDPSDFVRGKHDQLTQVLQQPKSEAREKKVISGIDEVFDYATLAERSLGREWKARTEEERKQFTELLEGLVRQSYRKSIDSTLGWNVVYQGKTGKDGAGKDGAGKDRAGKDRAGKDGEVVVATVAKHRSDARKAPVSVEYSLIQVDGKWRVVDVTVEGSSLVQNYRSQFVRIIKKKGFSELLSKMKARLAKGEG